MNRIFEITWDSMRRVSYVALLGGAVLALGGADARALSEIRRETLPTPEMPGPSMPGVEIPLPGADTAPGSPEGDPPATAPDESAPDDVEDQNDPSRPHLSTDGPPPEVQYDVEALPEPVRRMRSLILEATQKADIQALRPLIGTGESMTQLSLGGTDDDPIQFLMELSGDDQGHEILAILEEVLSAGYVRLDAGTPQELYVWPYFFAVPLESMTPRQRVELFKIVTAGDYEEMKAFGAYIFYRMGITPDGRWAFFVAGD